MKILFLVSRLSKPSCRLRVLLYLEYLKSRGHESEVIEISKKWTNRLKLYKHTKKFDATFLQKKVLSVTEFWFLKKQNNKIIFDIDDAIMFDDFGYKKKNIKPLEYILSNSSAVICGNSYLENICRKFEVTTYIIPTPIQTSRIPNNCLVKNKSSTSFNIGWLGSFATFKYFWELKGQFEELINKFNVKFTIISSKNILDKYSLNPPFYFEEWTEEKEYTLLSSLDIGLMPLPDNAFTRGKCAYKILQYQASGVIALASPVGMNQMVIEEGKTGYIVKNNEGWSSALHRVITDKENWETIRLNARKQIDLNYSQQVLQENFIKALSEIVGHQ